MKPRMITRKKRLRKMMTKKKRLRILTRNSRRNPLQIITQATMQQTMNQHQTQVPRTKELQLLKCKTMMLLATCTKMTTKKMKLKK
jgi:hypothetical protein